MGARGVVHLKRGKERKVRNFYPWIQRGECRAEGVEDGSLARLLDHEGEFLAWGHYNSQSRFQFRVLSLEDAPIDEGFYRARFRAAIARRAGLVEGTNAMRIVHGEADGMPGLIVDLYDRWLAVQVRSLGMERSRDSWLPALMEATGAEGAYERSEMAGREEEGLGPRSGLLAGDAPPEVEIDEDGLRFIVPMQTGLKTGFYLDQRNTRRTLAARVRPGDRVFDGFCYTGSFALHAARAGATVYGVDIAEDALDVARRNAAANGLEAVFVKANAFEYLPLDVMGPYDWIVLDPPAIAKTESRRDSLKWAIWRLVHEALPLLKPGGRLIACNCSYQLSLSETVEVCRLAGSDRNRPLCLEAVTLQDWDHPALVQFPESLYLKCVWLRG